jgi:hypothetical protein
MEFDEDVGIESIDEDEVGTDFVLDEACTKPDEDDGTTLLDKNESSLLPHPSPSENVVEATLDVDTTEYADDPDTDVVNSCARPLVRSCSLKRSGEDEYRYISGESGFRLTGEPPGSESEALSALATELPGRFALELPALVPLEFSGHDGDARSSDMGRVSATPRDPRFAMIGRLSFP